MIDMNNELGMKPPIGSLLSPYMVDTLHFVQRAGTLYLLTRYVRLSIGPCVDTGRERKKKIVAVYVISIYSKRKRKRQT